MKLRTFTHTGVKPDGTFDDKNGAVGTKGGVSMSQPSGGCGLEGCYCSEEHWLTISMPRTEDGVVMGISVTFDSLDEMNKTLRPNN